MNYAEKVKELQEKYADVVAVISRNENVDMGVAFDMFKKNVKNGAMYGWRDAEQDLADLKEAAEKSI